MDAILRTIKGERSLDFTFALWFFLGVGLVAINWLFVALTDRIGSSIPAAIVALLIVFAQIALVYGLGIGVLRASMVSDRPKVIRVCATILVVVAMVRLPFDYYGELTGAPAPVVTQAVSDSRTVVPARSADGLTAFQQTMVGEVEKTLPRRIDAVTTLSGIDFESALLIYDYDVDAVPGETFDVIAIKAERLPALCEALESLYRPHELEQIRHDFAFANQDDASITVRIAECRGQQTAGAATGDAPAGGGNFITKFETSTGIDL